MSLSFVLKICGLSYVFFWFIVKVMKKGRVWGLDNLNYGLGEKVM